ncbi:LOB domain-containing protein 22-like [Pyrus ussuriensis x Pyrus communis]|uniref:LOB domain-containing protein 22-like n=1 Tax=Pyrus ussuriensis x Pyrus communis TaxID=2448454 RepID=A0A5N5H5E5_9ROSA|nr:LOB domain-containing protein 22-like [Pyrus ussuriensis x Pyrus communis]
MANSKACAACKYQRRKCNQTCELAAYFPASRFVEFVNAQHMFGMSNIEKIIATVEPDQRPAAAVTILFEGNIWRNNPSVGCLVVTRFVLERVDFYEKELEYLSTLSFIAETSSKAQTRQQWTKPSSGGLKCNFDGAKEIMANSKACAACKYQRRKCNQTCELAAYFPASRFVEFVNAQHMFVELDQRPAAAETILFEGNIWRNNPSVGCLGVTRFLLEQVDFYEKELEFPRITADMKKYEERYIYMSSLKDAQEKAFDIGLMQPASFSGPGESRY